MNAMCMSSSWSLLAQPRLDVHQPVLVEERDIGSLSDDNPAQPLWRGLLPLAAQPVAIDAPGAGIKLRGLLALQRDGGAVGLKANAVGPFLGGVAVDECLARQELTERRPVEPVAICPGQRGIGADIREMPGIEHQPDEMAEIAQAEP